MTKPRILLADDHPEVLGAFRVLLSELGEVVGTVTDGQALVEAAQRLEPDLIFSDISMPGLNGLDATRALQTCAPRSKVIILTVHREQVYLSLALDAGARGYLLKRSAVAELPQAVLHVLAGDRYIGQGVSEEGVSGEEDINEIPGRGFCVGQWNEASGKEDLMSRWTEVRMEPRMGLDTSKVTPTNTCAHERVIDDVLTRQGKRTGKVRCLECGVVFDDPYRGQK